LQKAVAAAENRATEAIRERDDLLNTLEIRSSELSQLISDRDDISVTLQSRNRELQEAVAALAQAENEKREVINSHAGHILELEKSLNRAESNNAELLDNLNQISRDVQQIQSASASRTLFMEASHARAIAALRDKLIDTEAAAARWTAIFKNKNTWFTILSMRYELYKLQRELKRSGLFDADWYKTEYKDVAESEYTPVRHYIEIGYCRGYRPNPYFNTRWYLETNEDVRRSGMNPLLHYALYGCREGRDPSPEFQTNFYLLANPDVRAAGMNPLAHYLSHGRAQGRLPVRSSAAGAVTH
jgi:hypothetical protein